MCSRNILIALCLLSVAQLGYSQPRKPAGECTIKARSDAVVIMVCPVTSNADVWRTAGEAACESSQVCNAWVWDDDAKAPEKAPQTDAQLPKSRTAKAVAIWVNDSKSLVKLKKSGVAK
jgi:hypothetical protein